jgi:hypothetical protein
VDKLATLARRQPQNLDLFREIRQPPEAPAQVMNGSTAPSRGSE